jgi:hypothetical protein
MKLRERMFKIPLFPFFIFECYNTEVSYDYWNTRNLIICFSGEAGKSRVQGCVSWH